MQSIINKFRTHKFASISTFLVLVFVAIVFIRMESRALPEVPPARVTVATALNADVADTAQFTGSLEPAREVDIAAKTGGRVMGLTVDVGERVWLGQTLVELDGATTRMTAKSLQESVSAAEATRASVDAYYNQQISSLQTQSTSSQFSSDTGVTQTSGTVALTNTAILSNQVSDTLGALLSMRSGKESSIEIDFDNELGARDAGAKIDARSMLQEYQLTTMAYQIFFHDIILNKNPSQASVSEGLAKSVEVLTSAKLTLSRTYTVLMATPASSAASNAEIETYKASVLSLGTQVQSLLQNIHDVSTTVGTLQKARDSKLAEAEAQIVALKGEAGITNTILADGTIHASFAGVVTTKYIEEGAVVAPGTPLLHIVDDSVLKLTVGVPDERASTFHVGDRATIVSDLLPSQTFTGVISRINPSADSVSRKVTMELTMTNSDHLLKVGSYARVLFPKAHSASVAVPRTAVLSEYGASYVFVLTGTTVHRRMVTIGAESTDLVEIKSGVAQGEVVVTAGHSYLRDGDRVTPLGNIAI